LPLGRQRVPLKVWSGKGSNLHLRAIAARCSAN
jgi:hypothetical protein